MSFASSLYVLFLSIALLLVVFSPKRLGFYILIAACLFFYGWWNWHYISLLLYVTLAAYGGAFLLQKNKSPWALCLVISAILGTLLYFKYWTFMQTSINEAASMLGGTQPFDVESILLPIGISFFVFQTLSYVIDVYKGDYAPEKSFPTLLLFVSFFPQLIAGPIERAHDLMPQLRRLRDGVSENMDLSGGIFMIAVGLFVKLVLADNFAAFIDPMYAELQFYRPSDITYAPSEIAMSVYFFSAQIYCDFYGYTLMALGSARLFGIKLTQNFLHPYFATNIQTFWRCWHITLTRFFRDYVYIPLGGNKVSRPRLVLNLFVIMLLVGLWHGANYTFVIWGAIHGFYLATHRLFQRFATDWQFSALAASRVIWPTLGFLITFHLVSLAWIFFRAPTVEIAFQVFSSLGDALQAGTFVVSRRIEEAIAWFVVFWIFLVLDRYVDIRQRFTEAPLAYQVLALGMFCLSGYFGSAKDVQFIYFQF